MGIAYLPSPEESKAMAVAAPEIDLGEDEDRRARARIPREARRALYNLAARWSDVEDCRAMKVSPLSGAMTNEVFLVRWPSIAAAASAPESATRKVLVRVYGEGVEAFFDRDDEIRTFSLISRHGQGPRLLDRFSNGRIEEFIDARTLSVADLRDPEISLLIATKLREFHGLDMPGPKRAMLWTRLRNWLRKAMSLCPGREASEFGLRAMEEDISALEAGLSGENQRMGFCHNDLQYGNIMINEKNSSVTLIDYEYASMNPVAYDFANHFCEMAADYHSEKPHVLDFGKYPGLEERRRFVLAYLGSEGEQPDELSVNKLLEDIEKYTLASHLVWGLWGIISEFVNDIDFDYMEYARQRFQRYRLTKSSLLPPPASVPAA